MYDNDDQYHGEFEGEPDPPECEECGQAIIGGWEALAIERDGLPYTALFHPECVADWQQRQSIEDDEA